MRSAFQILKDTFLKILNNKKTFLFIIALPALISAAVSLIEPDVDAKGAYIWTSSSHMAEFFTAVIVLSIVSIFMTIATIFAASNDQLDAVDSYKLASKKVLQYLLMTIISTLILLISFLLLVIPGIWLSISLMFAIYFLVLKNTNSVESLKSSFRLVKGRWWTVLGKSLLFGLMYIAIAIPVYIALWIIGNFAGEDLQFAFESIVTVFGSLVAILFMYELFTDLEKTKVESVVAS